MYQAVVKGVPPAHCGRWGKANLDVCLSAFANPFRGLNSSANLDMSSVSTKKNCVWAGPQTAAEISSTPTSLALQASQGQWGHYHVPQGSFPHCV